MDIFQRTLYCQPLKEKDEEIDIFEAATDDGNEEEQKEEEAPQLEEEPLDIKALAKELDCMKKRIQTLQLHLKFRTDECPEEACVDYEVLLNCSENKDICDLQKNHHKLQCQNNELVNCCRAVRDHIEDLQLRMCEKAKEIVQLQNTVATLDQWKDTLEHEFGKCLERFEYLKHVKAEWKDVESKLDQQKKSYSAMEQAFVPKLFFLQEKKSFIGAINEMKQMLKELFEYQLQRFDCLEKRLDSVTGDH